MAIGAPSCFLYEIACAFEVFLVARHLIQLAESHLDDGMSARAVNLSLVGTERLTHKVGILNGHLKEILLARCTIVCHGTLDEVTGVIEFVRIDLFPLMGAPPSAQARTFICDASGEVAVRLLGLGDDTDHRVEIMVESGIIVYSQRIGCSFDDLIRVGIVEREISLMLALNESGSQREVVEPSIHLALVESRRDGYSTIDFYAWRPESVVQVYLCKRYLLNGGSGSRLLDSIRRLANHPQVGNKCQQGNTRQ